MSYFVDLGRLEDKAKELGKRIPRKDKSNHFLWLILILGSGVKKQYPPGLKRGCIGLCINQQPNHSTTDP